MPHMDAKHTHMCSRHYCSQQHVQQPPHCIAPRELTRPRCPPPNRPSRSRQALKVFLARAMGPQYAAAAEATTTITQILHDDRADLPALLMHAPNSITPLTQAMDSLEGKAAQIVRLPLGREQARARLLSTLALGLTAAVWSSSQCSRLSAWLLNDVTVQHSAEQHMATHLCTWRAGVGCSVTSWLRVKIPVHAPGRHNRCVCQACASACPPFPALHQNQPVAEG